MPPPTEYYIGAMSGTSLDGMDVVLVEFQAESEPKIEAKHGANHSAEQQTTVRIIDNHHAPYDDAFKKKLLTLCQAEALNVQELMLADIAVAEMTADCVSELLNKSSIASSSIRAIGSHGQTIRHLPPNNQGRGASLQIGDPNTIAAISSIPTVADFRRANLALGGQGAPITPAFHKMAFANATVTRSIVNIGGMANISQLNPKQSLVGFDTGPGNVLMDAWISKNKMRDFDKNGAWALQGSVNPILLKNLLAHPFFTQTTPKSTGREDFNLPWLEAQLEQLSKKISAVDVQATLLALTAHSIADAHGYPCLAKEVYVCGGGAFNNALVECLQELMSDSTVQTTAALGVDPQHIECCAFAWFAQQTMNRKKTPLTEFAGGSRETVLGGIFYG